MYPYMEAWDEVALWEANEKYGALFDKYFPELTTLETLLPPPPGTLRFSAHWHRLSSACHHGLRGEKKEYEIGPRILELEKSPSVYGIDG